MATPRSAFGTLLQVGAGSPIVYTSVALVGNITGPGMKADTIDVSNHNQATQYKQFISGMKEGGDVKFELFFDPTDTTHNEFSTRPTDFPGPQLDVFGDNYRV